MIPFLDLRSTYLELKDRIDASVSDVMNSGTYIGGSYVQKFEQAWACYCKCNYAVGVASGLDALILALEALGVGEGDEVIVPAQTFIATWLAVTRVGAMPVPVDTNLDDYNICVEKIGKAITSKTKAIIPVHLYGQPCNIREINEIAKATGLFVIEDAAQAHGARYEDERIGAHSDIVAWSFYPGKNLGAFGDAGAITTNKIDLYSRIKRLQNYGSTEKYVHTEIGYNSRLDPIQAAILLCKLDRLDAWTCRRAEIAELYSSDISNKNISIPFVHPHVTHAWHLYVVRTPCREKFMQYMSTRGIQTLIHYPIPPYLQKAYSTFGFKQGSLSISESTSKQIVSIPIYPHLSDNDVKKIIDAINCYDDNF